MRKIEVLALLFFCSMGIRAQEVSTQEENQRKKEINQLKLSEEVVYAEVIELATDDYEAVSLAQQKSITKLQASVIEACAEKMNMDKEAVKEIFDVIDDKCQNVVIKKGDMLRVFSYIAKDAIGLAPKKAKKEDIEEIFGTGEEVASTPTTKPEVKATPVVESKPEVKVEVKPEEKVEVKAEAAVVAQPEVKAEPKPEVKPEPAPKAEATVEVPALCQTILSKGNYAELRRYLDQEKSYGKLMYGGAKRMQYHEKCYIVIFEKDGQGIVTVLDKGQTERMNFVSKQMDTLNNYRNGKYQAIFVQEL